MKHAVGSLLLDDLTPEEAKIAAAALLGKGGCIATPNGEIAARAEKSPEEAAILNSMDLLVADGRGVALAARLQGSPLRGGTTPGIELGEALALHCAENGLPVFLLGAEPGIAEKAALKLLENAPDLLVCGTENGYFSCENDVVLAIKSADPALVLVCLGSPKQERFMASHREELPGVTMIGLGGSFDVWAGKTKRAPRLFRTLGLEWLYRLAAQPSRIGRVGTIPPYLFGALRRRRKS